MCPSDTEFSLPPSTASAEAHSLRSAVRHAFKAFAQTRPDLAHATDAELWIERAAAVLAGNIASGRYDGIYRHGQNNPASLSGYAQQVLAGVLAEWERVEALLAGDDKCWIAVLKRMEKVAYFWLGAAGREVWAIGEAREAAAKTCAEVWQWLQGNPFPFDVPFDRWSDRALRNRLKDSACTRRRQARHVVDSLDRPCREGGATLGELLPTDDIRAWLDREASREVLREATARLEQRQARIVHLWYVEGWSAEEIAAETRLDVGHVYVLKHRALKKLRAFCAEA